jgi:peptidoglycan/LPS O-acetylase OafA/YrhL
MGLICGSQALVNLPVVKSISYVNRWKLICNAITVLLFVFFLLEGLFGYFQSSLVYPILVFGEAIFPPLYAIWLYAFTQAPDSWSYQIFSWKYLRKLGDYSYAIYCLQFPIVQYYAWMRFGNHYFYTKESDDMTIQLESWESVPVFVILLIISMIVHNWIEKPCRRGLFSPMSYHLGLSSYSSPVTMLEMSRRVRIRSTEMDSSTSSSRSRSYLLQNQNDHDDNDMISPTNISTTYSPLSTNEKDHNSD